MKNRIQVQWPNGTKTFCEVGRLWLEEGKKNGVYIPTGCLNGSCGACEIEINGKVIRSCDHFIDSNLYKNNEVIKIDFHNDPYW